MRSGFSRLEGGVIGRIIGAPRSMEFVLALVFHFI
jgi:hypothetical protein